MNISIKDYAKESRIPHYVFTCLRNTGVIQDPLTPDDLAGLHRRGGGGRARPEGMPGLPSRLRD